MAHFLNSPHTCVGQLRHSCLQCCGSGMIFFGSGSGFEGSFGSGLGSCMNCIGSVSAPRELHDKLASHLIPELATIYKGSGKKLLIRPDPDPQH
jgi:hypothetical protein